MSSHADVLIIGAGAARLFCALGLKDSASVTVVEAGPDPGTPPPRWMLYDYLLPDECYFHYTDADTGLDLPQGRGTGGGSTVNSAAALRGQPWDFDGWDVPGWSWPDCLDGFRAIESDQQFAGASYHGADGPIPVTRLAPGPLDEALIELCAQRGYPAAPDHNAPGALGIGVWPTNRRDEGRWGTHAGVLPLIRPAVDVRTGTQVSRLLFDGTRCVGAEVLGPEGQQRLYADRVVVCAGAFGSSLLLMNSGIGPEAMLRRAGIGLVSPRDGVGANLQDHPWCLLDVDVTDVAAIEARPVSGALLRYELPGDHVEAEIFPWQTRPYAPSVPATQVSFTAALMSPLSRGQLTLTPDGGAEVRVRHLADAQDAARMAEIVTTTAELVRRAGRPRPGSAAGRPVVAGGRPGGGGPAGGGDVQPPLRDVPDGRPVRPRQRGRPRAGCARGLGAVRGRLVDPAGHPAGQHQPHVDDGRPARRPAPPHPGRRPRQRPGRFMINSS